MGYKVIMDKYDSVVRGVYKDLLKQENYQKRGECFVNIQNGVIKEIKLIHNQIKNNKTEILITFNLQFEREKELRAQNRIRGAGSECKFLPYTPGVTKRDEYDSLIIDNNTNVELLEDKIIHLLQEQIIKFKQINSEETLQNYLDDIHRHNIKNAEKKDQRERIISWIIINLFGISILIFSFCFRTIYPTFCLLMFYYACLCTTVTEKWFKSLKFFPLIEIAIFFILLIYVRNGATDWIQELMLFCAITGIVNSIIYITLYIGRKSAYKFQK